MTGPVDLVVRNLPYLITVDTQRRIITDAAVVITGGRFAWVGKDSELPEGLQPARTVDGSRFVGTPGLIDLHQHSSFQLSRGLADEANAQEFLIERMYPYEAAVGAKDVMVSASLASREMLLHGTTCFVDPGNNHPESTVEAVARTGQRMVLARSAFDQRGSNFGVVPESMVSTPDQAASEARELIDRFQGHLDGRITTSVSFRGLNNSSNELITALSAVATDAGAVLQTHAAFSYSTHDASVAKHGMSEIARLHHLGVLNDRMMLVHCGWLEPNEVELIRQSGAGVVAALTSSMHNGYGNIKMGLAPELRAMGVRVGLGSDHASSGPVDLVREMFLVSCGYKEARANPRVMPPEAALEMATIDAARILGMDDQLGSVEVGKRADLVLFDTDDPSWQPLYNPVSNLVYSANGSSAHTVVVDGQVLVEGGQLVSCDEAELVEEGRRVAADLYRRLDGDRLVRSQWTYV